MQMLADECGRLRKVECAAKADLLGKCSIFALPSSSDGLPMWVLEAWSYDMPVVMTPECHPSQRFRANAAICVEPFAGSIADGIRVMEQMPAADRRLMGLRGRELIATRFSWGQIGREMADAHETILYPLRRSN
jgi:glycosyltransferase involved in cell wall biosynthesis